MSGLVLKGNSLSQTGEYLPSVYIDKITIVDHGLTVNVDLFIPNLENRYVEEDESDATTTTVITDEASYRREMLANSEYAYYVVVRLYGQSISIAAGPWMSSALDLGSLAYDDIVENKTSIWDLIANSSVSFSDNAVSIFDTVPYFEGDEAVWSEEWTEAYGYDLAFLHQIDTETTGELDRVWDESGREYLRYRTQIEYTDEAWDWDKYNIVNDLQVFAFSSTYTYTADTIEEEREEPVLLDKKTGDLSYEKVWADGSLANRLQTEYIDDKGAIYDQVPLQATDSDFYKINRINHEEIVDFFENLVQQYSDDYRLEEVDENKYVYLRSAMDIISTVVASRGNKVDLVPAIKRAMALFPEKAPALPVGKFYRSLRKRLHTVDKLVRDSQKLRKKILYNGKIFDNRSQPPAELGSSWNEEISDCELIYENWVGALTWFYDWSTGDLYTYDEETLSYYIDPDEVINYDVDWHGALANGFIFFDYEKALRKTSILSRYMDVNKLENRGLHVPYSLYRVSQFIYMNKVGWNKRMGFESGEIDIRIKSNMDDSAEYPLTEYSSISDMGSPDPPDGGSPGANTNNPGGSSNWSNALSCTFLEDTRSHIQTRRLVDMSAQRWTDIDDYRLLTFSVMDYINSSLISNTALVWYDTVAYAADGGMDISPERTFKIDISDNTIRLVKQLDEVYAYYEEVYAEYVERCEQVCSANDSNNLFNAFFGESMMSEYEENMSQAPWANVPIFFSLFQDLLSDMWDGSDEKIVAAAAVITGQINPVNGNLEAVRNFQEALASYRSEITNIQDAMYDDGYLVYVDNSDYTGYVTAAGKQWYQLREEVEYSCEPIWPGDMTDYNDGQGIFPLEASDCNSMIEEGDICDDDVGYLCWTPDEMLATLVVNVYGNLGLGSYPEVNPRFLHQCFREFMQRFIEMAATWSPYAFTDDHNMWGYDYHASYDEGNFIFDCDWLTGNSGALSPCSDGYEDAAGAVGMLYQAAVEIFEAGEAQDWCQWMWEEENYAETGWTFPEYALLAFQAVHSILGANTPEGTDMNDVIEKLDTAIKAAWGNSSKCFSIPVCGGAQASNSSSSGGGGHKSEDVSSKQFETREY